MDYDFKKRVSHLALLYKKSPLDSSRYVAKWPHSVCVCVCFFLYGWLIWCRCYELATHFLHESSEVFWNTVIFAGCLILKITHRPLLALAEKMGHDSFIYLSFMHIDVLETTLASSHQLDEWVHFSEPSYLNLNLDLLWCMPSCKR